MLNKVKKCKIFLDKQNKEWAKRSVKIWQTKFDKILDDDERSEALRFDRWIFKKNSDGDERNEVLRFGRQNLIKFWNDDERSEA